jgi:uncharacterized damage-inducible protein DinB
MIIQTISSFLARDISQVKLELELYQHEKTIWQIENGIANSAGNLCLHLLGNLNGFICAGIGNSGYVRNRPLEFSEKNIPRSELIHQLDKTKDSVSSSLELISDDVLDQNFPLQIFDNKSSYGHMLIHIVTHLNYHLGQINYHRRLLDERP